MNVPPQIRPRSKSEAIHQLCNLLLFASLILLINSYIPFPAMIVHPFPSHGNWILLTVTFFSALISLNLSNQISLKNRIIANFGFTVFYLIFTFIYLVSSSTMNHPNSLIRTKIFADEALFISAIKAYHAEYNRWPCTTNGKPDRIYGNQQKEIIDILTGNDPINNPKERVFMEFKNIKNGQAIDPLDRPYKIVMDTDNDGNCMTEFGLIKGKTVCIWTESESIRSWETNSFSK